MIDHDDGCTYRMKAIVVDLDGTLSNSAHRDHLALSKEWDEFHSLAKDDSVYPEMVELLGFLEDKVEIIVVTGRGEKYRPMTMRWLSANCVHVDHLIMRPEGDWTADTTLKPSLVEKHFGRLDVAVSAVLFVLEDRDRMVEAWRSYGFVCFQVRPGA